MENKANRTHAMPHRRTCSFLMLLIFAFFSACSLHRLKDHQENVPNLQSGSYLLIAHTTSNAPVIGKYGPRFATLDISVKNQAGETTYEESFKYAELSCVVCVAVELVSQLL